MKISSFILLNGALPRRGTQQGIFCGACTELNRGDQGISSSSRIRESRVPSAIAFGRAYVTNPGSLSPWSDCCAGSQRVAGEQSARGNEGVSKYLRMQIESIFLGSDERPGARHKLVEPVLVRDQVRKTPARSRQGAREARVMATVWEPRMNPRDMHCRGSLLGRALKRCPLVIRKTPVTAPWRTGLPK